MATTEPDLQQTQDKPKAEHPRFNFRRLKAALDLRWSSVEAIARDAQVTSRHCWFVLAGERKPSDRLLAVIRAAVGESGWAFAIGQTDTLRDEGGNDGQT